MSPNQNLERFRFDPALCRGFAGKRVLITGSGKEGGLGQAFAMAAGLNGASAVGVHFFRSYEDGFSTCERINAAGGNAFPVQADVTNTSDVWATRRYIMDKMGGPPDVLICNSGLSERGYRLGRAVKERDDEPTIQRRARARAAFVDNLSDSSRVLDTKLLGFLYMTHLWVGEAQFAKQPIKIIYISSRQAVDAGAGVPGYVMANYAVLSLPEILRVNLGRRADMATAFSVCYPFVHTNMTDALVGNEKVYGRWQPRMLETWEAACALSQLASRPDKELAGGAFQLNVDKQPDDAVRVTWSRVSLAPTITPLEWSQGAPLDYSPKPD